MVVQREGSDVNSITIMFKKISWKTLEANLTIQNTLNILLLLDKEDKEENKPKNEGGNEIQITMLQ